MRFWWLVLILACHKFESSDKWLYSKTFCDCLSCRGKPYPKCGQHLIKGMAEGRLFVLCSVGLFSHCQLYLCVLDAANSFASIRTMVSKHPLLTSTQWLSRKLPNFKCLIGTTEATSSMDEAFTGFSDVQVWDNNCYYFEISYLRARPIWTPTGVKLPRP